MAYPIKYIENNLVFNHDGECFAYYELLPYNYSFLNPEQKYQVHDSFRQLIAQNRDGKIHALQISTESSIRAAQERSKQEVTGRLSTLSGCTKDEILNHYNNVVQSAGSIELTGKLSLQGKKEKGIDDYTGSYQADYENFSDTEYLFGGTSIKREAGKDISVTCTLEVLSGTAKVFWISGADEAVTLLETTGTYSDTITLPDGGNYIGIECEDFTGKIEMNIK